jgi:S-DNA-T family DNA segregation ATPase FtsK/SpoIIIE
LLKSKPQKMKDQAKLIDARGVRESLLVLFCGIAVILFLSLISFDLSDSSYFVVSDADSYSNLIGAFGANVSAILFTYFGIVSYLFIPILVLTAVYIYQNKNPINQRTKSENVLGSIGIIIFVLSSASLIQLFPSIQQLPEGIGTGGIIGDSVFTATADYLDISGSIVLFIILLLASISLSLHISWVMIVDKSGSLILNILSRFLSIIQMTPTYLNQFLSKIKFKRKEKPLESARAIHQRKIEKVRQRPKTKIEPKVQAIETSKRSEEAKQVKLFDTAESGQLPELSLLDDAPDKVSGYSEDTLQAMSKLLEIKLADFNIAAEVISVKPGPVVTRFEIQPAAGVKVSQISNLSKDLARALSTVSVRVVEVIPGKPYVGIEIPNEQREVITLGEIIKSKDYDEIGSTMAIALGKDISGNPVVADLAKMPHLLIAGTTGSGKSVGINAMILSLLYKSTPKDVKLILIDPKMLELSVYDGIPNLFTEVVTDMKKAAAALKWCVAEMDKRYRLMSHLGVRNLAGYNKKINDSIRDKQPILDPLWKSTEQLSDEPKHLEPLPNIVIVIDELADLMLVVGKAVEELIARLAQKARASGIHMIVATQRPSVDVITGLIKANIPSRIAFQVSAKVDSRTILDQMGAECLLGNGDMLYLPSGTSIPMRVHGAFVSDQEVHRIVNDLKKSGKPEYNEAITTEPAQGGDEGSLETDSAEDDPLYDQAVKVVTETDRASISYVQRRLKIGYNRAARIVETMEATGVIAKKEGSNNYEVIAASAPDE